MGELCASHDQDRSVPSLGAGTDDHYRSFRDGRIICRYPVQTAFSSNQIPLGDRVKNFRQLLSFKRTSNYIFNSYVSNDNYLLIAQSDFKGRHVRGCGGSYGEPKKSYHILSRVKTIGYYKVNYSADRKNQVVSQYSRSTSIMRANQDTTFYHHQSTRW